MKLIVAIVIAWILWFLQGVFWSRRWSNGLETSLSFNSHSASEGEHATLTETITNRKFLPLPALHVKFQMGRDLVFLDSANSRITDQNYRNDTFACMPWQEIRRTLEFTCKKRGYYTIRQIDLVSYDLFQYSHFVLSQPVNTAMYVYPKAIDPKRLDLPLKNLLGQILAKQSLIRDPFEMQSIRPYQSYDSYRDINWKATAKTGNLKVNVYGPTASWQVTFLLDVDSDLIWEDHDLTEEAIRLCGSMAEQLLHQGVPVSVFTNGLDLLSGSPGFLDVGAGNDHLTAVMELLARIVVDEHSTTHMIPGWQISSGQTAPGQTTFGHTASGHFSSEQTSSGQTASSQEFPHRQSMEFWLKQLLLQGSSHQVSDHRLYVLLSPMQRDSLTEAYASLCQKCPGSQWILPIRPGDPVRIAEIPRCIEFYSWEVPYDRS